MNEIIILLLTIIVWLLIVIAKRLDLIKKLIACHVEIVADEASLSEERKQEIVKDYFE